MPSGRRYECNAKKAPASDLGAGAFFVAYPRWKRRRRRVVGSEVRQPFRHMPLAYRHSPRLACGLSPSPDLLVLPWACIVSAPRCSVGSSHRPGPENAPGYRPTLPSPPSGRRLARRKARESNPRAASLRPAVFKTVPHAVCGCLPEADTVGLEPTHDVGRVRISNPLHYRSATCPRGGVRICPTPLVSPTPFLNTYSYLTIRSA